MLLQFCERISSPTFIYFFLLVILVGLFVSTIFLFRYMLESHSKMTIFSFFFVSIIVFVLASFLTSDSLLYCVAKEQVRHYEYELNTAVVDYCKIHSDDCENVKMRYTTKLNDWIKKKNEYLKKVLE